MGRARLKPRRRKTHPGRWALYYIGRVLQVTGLVVALVAASAFFGTPSTLAMLRMMMVGVLLFIAGWLLTLRDPRKTD